MGRFIVLDIVFYGSSLNYDQGTGNYQELKKITKWDGKQYTLVSKYALRYSLLKTAEDLGLWKNAPGTSLTRAGGGGKTTIQPSKDLLFSGEILKYPEFDLFGYLITETTPQNSREAPVKIDHAISMTPYNYDQHFCANLWLARRMVEAGIAEEMSPNPFTIEEHKTFYIYTVVIDVDRIGKNEIYLTRKGGLSGEKTTEEETGEKGRKSKSIEIKDIKKENDKLIVKLANENKEYDLKVPPDSVKVEKLNDKLFKIMYSLGDNEKIDRIKDLIKAFLHLKRNIKGRVEDLSPKLLILGLYKGPYKTFKDKIILTNKYEEIFEEITEPIDKGTRIIRRIVKLEKPTFIIDGFIIEESKGADEKTEAVTSSNPEQQAPDKDEMISLLDEDSIISLIDGFLKNDQEFEEIRIFHAPEINVEVKEMILKRQREAKKTEVKGT